MSQDTTRTTQHAPHERKRAKRHTQHHAQGVHTGEQEPGGPGHRAHNTTHRACTPVNTSQKAQDTAHAPPHTERAHRRTGAGRPRTPYTHHHTQSVQTGEQEPGGPGHRTRTQSVHTGEQEPGGPGHRTRNTTRRACAPVNRSREAQDTVHTAPHAERAHRLTGAGRPRTPYTQHHTQSVHTGEQEPGGPGHRTRRACTPVNRSREAQDAVHATPHTERTHR